MSETNASPMGSFADVRRRLEPGVQLECVEHSYVPNLVGSVRTVEGGKSVLRCSVDLAPGQTWPSGGQKPARDFRWDLPKAGDVRIIDSDTFEYDLEGRSGHHVRLRFLTTQSARS